MIKISVTRKGGDIRKNLNFIRTRMQAAISASANMAASMMQEQMRANIGSSGGDLGSLSDNLHVVCTVGNMRATIDTFHDRPYAGIFEEGGTITGSLLWIPLSDTDAKGVRAADYPGGLFSVRRETSGRPLLFSISDKKPKYFGIESVTIPQKWNLRGVQASVLAGYRALYNDAFKAA